MSEESERLSCDAESAEQDAGAIVRERPDQAQRLSIVIVTTSKFRKPMLQPFPQRYPRPKTQLACRLLLLGEAW
ncbi:hypothetical protein KCU83_g334, partial [Aureobasidium melanogenum]